jgi:hypothetical protein
MKVSWTLHSGSLLLTLRHQFTDNYQENQTAFFTDGARPPCCPPRHRMPPQPRAERLAVHPAGRTQAAGRLTRRSCLGLGDRPQTSANRSETLPRWARGSEKQARVRIIAHGFSRCARVTHAHA